MFKKISLRRFLIGVLMLFIALYTIERSVHIENVFGFPLRDYLIANSYQVTRIKNTVTAVYLDYRYFDTLIEASVLMFTTIACVYFSTFEREDK